ncbi:MAG: ABC transporter ATP-binding protein, partial [Flavobacteriaceae bacterium]|nr:ABC transporter ATP-binding protein [Flavobacteriaceae bacterium]
MDKGLIHINQLAKKYKDSDYFAVNPLNLSIQKNEIFGLLGPNGAGKTTLISMLCGLIKPTSGTIEIKQLNYKNNKLQIQNLIGVVPQEYALYPTLTAFENLIYFGAMYGLKEEDL